MQQRPAQWKGLWKHVWILFNLIVHSFVVFFFFPFSSFETQTGIFIYIMRSENKWSEVNGRIVLTVEGLLGMVYTTGTYLHSIFLKTFSVPLVSISKILQLSDCFHCKIKDSSRQRRYYTKIWIHWIMIDCPVHQLHYIIAILDMIRSWKRNSSFTATSKQSFNFTAHIRKITNKCERHAQAFV